MSDIDLTEQKAAWQIVAHAWHSWWPNSYDPSVHMTLLEEKFVIDDSVPSSIVLGPKFSDREPKLELTQAQAYAALEYWRAHMIEAVDEIAARARAAIAAQRSESTEGNVMSKLTAAMIEGVRHELKSGIDELLACDELWNNKLTSDILEAARSELDGHRDILDDTSERYDQTLANRDYFFLLRDLIVSGMASKLLVAWARQHATESRPI